MTSLLASVTNRNEALLSLDAGADIIDCKDPMRGALGALSVPLIQEIVCAVGQQRPVSATIGDLPTTTGALIPAIRRVAATGVDYVKLGLFDTTGASDVVAALAPTNAAHHRLIAVLFADCSPNLAIIPELAAAGFSGVMMDTANKGDGTLLDLMQPRDLGEFVRQAHCNGLLCGLAGSLRLGQIEQLLPLQADYLGFRGALCEQGRTSGLSRAACTRIRAAIPVDRASEARPEAA